MRISKAVKRLVLVVPSCILLSAVTWGQSWGPAAAVQVEVGGPPVRLVEVDRRWDDRRWEERREWREREWRRHHRREERREYRRYRGY